MPRYLLAGVALMSLLSPAIACAENNAAAVERVGEDIRYLASDELEGRGPGTKGLQIAADHIAARFQSLGLGGGGVDGGFTKPFEIPIDTKVIEDQTRLVLNGPDGKRLELEMGKDFQPLAVGGNGAVKADVVFAGYGITAPKLKYDDYRDADVEGKVVVVIRREPQQGQEDSVFDGKKTSSHAFIRSKLQAAKKAKAAAILFVNDPFSTKDKEDKLTGPSGFGTRGSGLPFLHVSQQVADQMLAASPLKDDDKSLASVQAVADAIDAELRPRSQPLDGWTADLQCRFEPVNAEVTNVIGVLEGEGPLADETIVIGAHYDHLGYGPFGSRRPDKREVHNGADDNATGTAAVLELANRLSRGERKPRRRIVFVAFTAEERGILGSNRYLQKPAFPLDKTVAMINFDMIGQFKKQGLTVGGIDSSKQFGEIVVKASEAAEVDVKRSRSVGGSDHAGFYNKGIPVMFFHTGLTDLYHTPDDDFETIDVAGAVKAIDLAEQVVRGIDALDKAPEFVKVQPPGPRPKVYLGVVPQFKAGQKGAGIKEVAADSPAAKGGLQVDDVIVKLDDIEIGDFRALAKGLAKYKKGDKAKLVLLRDGSELSLEVTLAGPPQ